MLLCISHSYSQHLLWRRVVFPHGSVTYFDRYTRGKTVPWRKCERLFEDPVGEVFLQQHDVIVHIKLDGFVPWYHHIDED